MATSKRELSARANGNGEKELIIRLSVRRGLQPRFKTGLFINPSRFNEGKKDPAKAGCFIYPRANQKEIAELRKVESTLIEMERYLIDLCSSTPGEQLTKDFITGALDRYRHPDQGGEPPRGFYEIFEDFVGGRSLSERRIKSYNVLERSMKRFEMYRQTKTKKPYRLALDEFCVDDVRLFEEFLRDEPKFLEKDSAVYKKCVADGCMAQKPHAKGNNTVVYMLKALRAFFNWCNAQGLTDNKPFAKYSGVTGERYGTPYYISIEERNQIADFDLSAVPETERQRDIFIFHCLIGCRVSDLMRLTPDNIINGGVEYIASKTKGERPDVIRVPLHPRALALVEKYAGVDQKGRLFPFISPQRYNDAIKKVFRLCGITRSVTILNPTTGKEEQRPINEVASSHIARRTFVGNLYKQVKDPNLVGKLSGHKEGSRAFVRYRDIDEDMKRDLISLL